MPGLVQSYDVLLDFTNDTHDYTSLQLLRDYNNRNGSTAGAVLIPPGETVTLVLDAGSVYKYVLKTCTKVASVTYVSSSPLPLPPARPSPGPVSWRRGGYFISEPGSILTCFPPYPYWFSARTWRDVDCPVSSLFVPSGSTSTGFNTSQPRLSSGGVSVDKVWKDMRVAIWDWEDRL
jgi:hypothetical protein